MREAESSLPGPTAKQMGMNGVGDAEKHLGVQPNWFSKIFAPIRQFAEKYPQLRDVANLGYEYQAMARRSQTKILEPFITEGTLGKSKIDFKGTGVLKVIRDPAALEAFNKIALMKNERGDADPNYQVMQESEMRSHMNGVPKDKQDAVIAMHRAIEQAAPKSAEVLINGRYTQLARFASRAMLNANPTLGWKEAMADGENLVRSLRTGLPADPVMAQKWGTGLETAMQVLGGEKGLFARTQELEQKISNKPWWTPEVRLGRYMVAWKDGAVGFDDKSAAVKFAEGKNESGVKTRMWDKTVKNEDTRRAASIAANVVLRISKRLGMRRR